MTKSFSFIIVCLFLLIVATVIEATPKSNCEVTSGWYIQEGERCLRGQEACNMRRIHGWGGHNQWSYVCDQISCMCNPMLDQRTLI